MFHDPKMTPAPNEQETKLGFLLMAATLLVAPTALYLLNSLLPAGGWLSLMLKIGVFSLLYLPYAWKLLLDDYEKGLVRSILRRFKRKEA